MKLKPLCKEYTNRGYRLNLLKRQDNIALYRTVSMRNHATEGFEVHKIRVVPVTGILKKSPDFANRTHYEANPSDNDFGKYGWYYPDLESAEKKFAEVLSR